MWASSKAPKSNGLPVLQLTDIKNQPSLRNFLSRYQTFIGITYPNMERLFTKENLPPVWDNILRYVNYEDALNLALAYPEIR